MLKVFVILSAIISIILVNVHAKGKPKFCSDESINDEKINKLYDDLGNCAKILHYH